MGLNRHYRLLLGLDLLRLVAPPLQPGVVGPYPVWGVWFPSRLTLEGTDHIQNFGAQPVACCTRSILPQW
jgi:hypothetical protein